MEGHALLDGLKRLWMIKDRSGIKQLEDVRKARFDVLIPPSFELDRALKEVLNASEGLDSVGPALTRVQVQARDRTSTMIAESSE